MNSSNVTDVKNSDVQPRIVCDRNAGLTSNTSLFEVNLKRLFENLFISKFSF
jgi:hypothetical protein